MVATSLSARAIGTETLTVGGTSQPGFSRPSSVTKSSGGLSLERPTYELLHTPKPKREGGTETVYEVKFQPKK